MFDRSDRTHLQHTPARDERGRFLPADTSETKHREVTTDLFGYIPEEVTCLFVGATAPCSLSLLMAVDDEIDLDFADDYPTQVLDEDQLELFEHYFPHRNPYSVSAAEFAEVWVAERYQNYFPEHQEAEYELVTPAQGGSSALQEGSGWAKRNGYRLYESTHHQPRLWWKALVKQRRADKQFARIRITETWEQVSAMPTAELWQNLYDFVFGEANWRATAASRGLSVEHISQELLAEWATFDPPSWQLDELQAAYDAEQDLLDYHLDDVSSTRYEEYYPGSDYEYESYGSHYDCCYPDDKHFPVEHDFDSEYSAHDPWDDDWYLYQEIDAISLKEEQAEEERQFDELIESLAVSQHGGPRGRKHWNGAGRERY